MKAFSTAAAEALARAAAGQVRAGLSATPELRALRNHPGDGAHRPDPEQYLAGLGLEEINPRYDRQLKLFWCEILYRSKPSFTPKLLTELGIVQQAVMHLHADARHQFELDYFVCRSAVPEIFGLGGDLSLFATLIRRQDRATLVRYAEACIDRVFLNWQAMDLPLVTVSLVQGSCLGGAFECALSSNLIVAERRAKMGLPEILFNLFPGMGAYSFLARRVGARLARQIVGSGRIYTGEELHEMGIVDVIADDGKGEAALLDHIHENRPKRGLRHYFDKIDRLVQPIEKNELLAIAELWVDRALEIGESDLKLMERLAAAQMRQFHNLTAGRAAAVGRTATSG